MGALAETESKTSTPKDHSKKTINRTVLALGDSLTEGYGVAKEKAFPALLEKKISRLYGQSKVINSGLGGATSASALSRLRWSLRAKPSVLILALGANDGLRGISIEATEKNLSSAIQLAQKEKVQVVLAGMRLPPNYGEDYSGEFRKMYARLADQHQLKMIPFLLKDVAGRPEVNLPDGIHPNEKGHQIISETVFDFLLKEVWAERSDES